MLNERSVTEVLANKKCTAYHLHRCSQRHWACHCHQKWGMDLRMEVCVTTIHNPATENSHPITLLCLVLRRNEPLIYLHSKGTRKILHSQALCQTLCTLQGVSILIAILILRWVSVRIRKQ